MAMIEAALLITQFRQDPLCFESRSFQVRSLSCEENLSCPRSRIQSAFQGRLRGLYTWLVYVGFPDSGRNYVAVMPTTSPSGSR